MAAISTAQSGNYSDPNTWVGGVIPGEGDTVSILNGHTVTIDQNITVGADTTTAAINVNAGGKLQLLSTVAADYTLTLKGDLYNSGTIEIGTTANPIPSTRIFTIKLNYSATLADGEFGFINNNGSTLIIQGASKTYDRTKLAADAAAGATTLTTDVSTGWKANDEIGIASTTRTYSQCEKRTLSVDASTTTLTITAGLTNGHSGTSPTQAEIINLTRNIKITAYNTAYVGYVRISTTATIDIDWCEFSYLGENATNKRGIDIVTTTGSCNIQNSSLHDFEDYGVYISGTTANNITFSNNVLYNCPSVTGYAIDISQNTSGTALTFDNNIVMLTTALSGYGFYLADVGGSFTNNTVVGTTGHGFYLADNGGLIGSFSGNTVHSCANNGFYIYFGLLNSTLSSITVWRCNGFGMHIYSGANFSSNVILDNFTFFGNVTANIRFSYGSSQITLNNFVSNGDSSFSTTYGIQFGDRSATFNLVLRNCDFSTISGIKTAHSIGDIHFGNNSYATVISHNSKFGAATEVYNISNAVIGSYLKSQKHDQTAGLHKSFFKYGTISIDTTIKDGATGASQRLTPNNATNKLESGSKKVAVANGNTVTVSVKVRESVTADGADYNGARARLIVKRNDAMGITADTVLATATAASEGAFETIQGTTIAVTDDGLLEFVVDCSGTTGWLNIDSWTTS